MEINNFELIISKRAAAGSSKARGLRANGQVPVELYNKSGNISGVIDSKELRKALNEKTLFNKLTKAKVDGKSMLLLGKVMQKDPVRDTVLHIDFQIIGSENDVIQANVPIHYVNADKCEAIKLGGILNIVHRHIHLKGKAKQIPSFLEYDLTKSQSGVSIRINEDIKVAGEVVIHRNLVGKVAATILASKKKEESAEAKA